MRKSKLLFSIFLLFFLFIECFSMTLEERIAFLSENNLFYWEKVFDSEEKHELNSGLRDLIKERLSQSELSNSEIHQLHGALYGLSIIGKRTDRDLFLQAKDVKVVRELALTGLARLEKPNFSDEVKEMLYNKNTSGLGYLYRGIIVDRIVVDEEATEQQSNNYEGRNLARSSQPILRTVRISREEYIRYYQEYFYWAMENFDGAGYGFAASVDPLLLQKSKLREFYLRKNKYYDGIEDYYELIGEDKKIEFVTEDIPDTNHKKILESYIVDSNGNKEPVWDESMRIPWEDLEIYRVQSLTWLAEQKKDQASSLKVIANEELTVQKDETVIADSTLEDKTDSQEEIENLEEQSIDSKLRKTFYWYILGAGK